MSDDERIDAFRRALLPESADRVDAFRPAWELLAEKVKKQRPPLRAVYLHPDDYAELKRSVPLRPTCPPQASVFGFGVSIYTDSNVPKGSPWYDPPEAVGLAFSPPAFARALEQRARFRWVEAPRGWKRWTPPRATLERRALYGGRKGRRAERRLRDYPPRLVLTASALPPRRAKIGP